MDLNYLKHSMYAHHLGRLMGLFPRAQVHVVILERMIRDPEGQYRKTCRFLGVDDSYRPPNLGATVNSCVRFRSLAVRNVVERLPHCGLRRVLTRFNTRNVRRTNLWTRMSRQRSPTCSDRITQIWSSRLGAPYRSSPLFAGLEEDNGDFAWLIGTLRTRPATLIA